MARHKQPIHPLLSTTYQLHRLSPLYKFPSLNPKEHPPSIHSSAAAELSGRQTTPSPFKPYERALTNLLRGDILRGVAIGSDSTEIGELGKLGKFKQCKWRLVPTLAALREYNAEEALKGVDEDSEDETEEENADGAWVKAVIEQRDVMGVEITFDYDRGVAGYIAYIVGLSQKDLGIPGEFTHLPLVLTRLPKPLIKVLFEYLETAFDTLVLPMGVSNGCEVSGEEGIAEPETGWLETVLEMYVEQTKKTLNKDITLSYKVPDEVGVKMITVGLDKGDIVTFLDYGKSLAKNLSGNRKRKRGEEEENLGEIKPKGPLMLAVEKHMDSTMGMDASKLVLVKVACGGFVVGGGTGGGADVSSKVDMETTARLSGRVKMFPPRAGHVRDGGDEDEEADEDGRSPEEVALEMFLDSLVQLAVKNGAIGSSNITGDEGTEALNKKKMKSTTGRIPRGKADSR